MSNLKHTPGKWEPMCAKLVGAMWVIGNNKVIAHMGANDEDANFPNKQEAFANAKLIASAPELLEALIQLKASMDETINWFGGLKNLNEAERIRYKVICNAIKKTTE